MQPQIGATISLIQKNGGKISHSDLLENLGYDILDRRGSGIIKKIAYRLRHGLVKNEGGYLILTKPLEEIDSEIYEALAEYSKSSIESKKFYEHSKFMFGVLIGLFIGFAMSLVFVSSPVYVDLSNLPLCVK